MADSYYFDGQSSRRFQVTLYFENGLLRGAGNNNMNLFVIRQEECRVQPRLGSAPVVIELNDGACIHTRDYHLVVLLEKALSINQGFRMVHQLEKYWKLTLVCLVILLTLTAGSIKFGIPYLAKHIAEQLPDALVQMLSTKSIEAIDEHWMNPTKLSEKKQAELKTLFKETADKMASQTKFTLLLRSSSYIPVNAFALPSGEIIMTDGLVELSENNTQIQGVLVHEMQHVIASHGLRSVLQNSGVFLLVSLMVGDITSITATAATLPTLLVQSNYSQTFEKEADLAVVHFFKKQPQSIRLYTEFLTAISQKFSKNDVPSWLSTHPNTKDRVKYILAE